MIVRKPHYLNLFMPNFADIYHSLLLDILLTAHANDVYDSVVTTKQTDSLGILSTEYTRQTLNTQDKLRSIKGGFENFTLNQTFFMLL